MRIQTKCHKTFLLEECPTYSELRDLLWPTPASSEDTQITEMSATSGHLLLSINIFSLQLEGAL